MTGSPPFIVRGSAMFSKTTIVELFCLSIVIVLLIDGGFIVLALVGGVPPHIRVADWYPWVLLSGTGIPVWYFCRAAFRRIEEKRIFDHRQRVELWIGKSTKRLDKAVQWLSRVENWLQDHNVSREPRSLDWLTEFAIRKRPKLFWRFYERLYFAKRLAMAARHVDQRLKREPELHPLEQKYMQQYHADTLARGIPSERIDRLKQVAIDALDSVGRIESLLRM